MDDDIALAEVLEPVRGFLGTWRGEGSGRYPTIETFSYREEVQFWHVGKPFLGYQQRTRHPETGAPMHAESGFWRVVGPLGADGAAPVEVTMAHPTGITEVSTGAVANGRIAVVTESVTRSPTAKEVTIVQRTMAVTGDVLTYEVHMAAVGQPLQFHLAATLRRVG